MNKTIEMRLRPGDRNRVKRVHSVTNVTHTTFVFIYKIVQDLKKKKSYINYVKSYNKLCQKKKIPTKMNVVATKTFIF